MSKSYYADVCKNPKYLDEFTIGMYHPDGGTSGEFDVIWEMVGMRWTPRLRAFGDSWSALSKFHDLLYAMAESDDDGADLTPDEFEDILFALDIECKTPTERPQ